MNSSNNTSKFWFCGLFAALLGLLSVHPVYAQIFVANPIAGTVGEFNTDGTTVNASLISGLHDASDVVVSGSDLFVISNDDTNNLGTVGEYTTSGATVNASLVTGLNTPSGLAVSGSDLFVASIFGGTIGEYTTSGATVNTSLVSMGADDIAVSGGELFVLNSNTIGEYTTSGAVVNASLITAISDGMYITVSGSDIFVISYGPNDPIREYTTSGATVNASLITGLDEPTSITVSGSDLFIASEDNNGTLGEYTTSGSVVNASLITGLNSTPEPSTWAMMLGGLGLLAFWRLRMRRRLACVTTPNNAEGAE